jgi:hypothetical protein
MRKHLVWALGLAVALMSVGFAGLASGAPNNQEIEVTVKPKKLPKTERKPISLNTNVFATNPSNPQGVPFPTTFARVDFSKNMLIQQKGFPTCDPNQFGAASTIQDVRDECGDAVVGTGTATVLVPTGPSTPPLQVDAQTIGANVAGKKILLHSYNSLSGGQPLLGQFVKAKGKYGTTLNVPVPPLAGGTAVITQFGLDIKKKDITYRFKGKKRAVISSNCKDKTMDFQARFTDNQGQLATGTDTFKCTRKG